MMLMNWMLRVTKKSAKHDVGKDLGGEARCIL